MKDETIAAELTADLRDFLEKRGYSHIRSLGIEPKEVNDASEPETGKENYWLSPLKPGDEQVTVTGEDAIVHAINDAVIMAMVAGKDEIEYMVKVPLVDYNDYLAKR